MRAFKDLAIFLLLSIAVLIGIRTVWATLTPGGTGNPTITSTVISGTTDRVLNLSNGGHLSSLLGTGAAVTSGTGAVTAGSTDTAGEVTGCTSGCTVTFGVPFTVKPVCLCTDETSSTQTCKSVPNANGLTVVFTTTGTDSFGYICIGK